MNELKRDTKEAYRIDVSSLPTFTRRWFQTSTYPFIVHKSVHEGKVVIDHENSDVRRIIRRVILSL